MANISLSKLIAPYYYGLHNDIMNNKHRVYRLKGGRGSLKTSTIVIEVLLLMQRDKHLCTAVFMKQGNRLRRGAFSAYIEGIKRAGLSEVYKISHSPMRLRNVDTNQTIDFFGLDDGNKTKGISTGNPDTYYGITHFEELDQFSGNDEIRTAVASVTRGGNKSWCFQCYNPPKNANNWVNKDSLLDVDGRLVHTSDYRIAPLNWLGTAFMYEVKACIQSDMKEYLWRYLGEVIGITGSIFQNVREWNKSDVHIDLIFQGIDLGWNDPKSFVRLGYCCDNKSVYILDEFVASETTNMTLAEWILSKGYTDVVTYIESAGGAEAQLTYTACGIPTDIVNKGNNLKLNGIEWLSSRKNIFIDKSLCPRCYEEFTEYEWKKDRDGNVISPECPVDGNDHTIDASRYAISSYLKDFGGLL